MRNIHLYIQLEYREENVKEFWKWKKIENKMADFKNHRGFLLRCLSKDVIPVSSRVKSNIKTPKGYHIIKKAERALLNERIRSINTINMFICQRDTCIDQLNRVLDKATMKKCAKFINMTRESRHKKTLECQRLKFERLCQKYKGGTNTYIMVTMTNKTKEQVRQPLIPIYLQIITCG